MQGPNRLVCLMVHGHAVVQNNSEVICSRLHEPPHKLTHHQFMNDLMDMHAGAVNVVLFPDPQQDVYHILRVWGPSMCSKWIV